MKGKATDGVRRATGAREGLSVTLAGGWAERRRGSESVRARRRPVASPSTLLRPSLHCATVLYCLKVLLHSRLGRTSSGHPKRHWTCGQGYGPVSVAEVFNTFGCASSFTAGRYWSNPPHSLFVLCSGRCFQFLWGLLVVSSGCLRYLVGSFFVSKSIKVSSLLGLETCQVDFVDFARCLSSTST